MATARCRRGSATNYLKENLLFLDISLSLNLGRKRTITIEDDDEMEVEVESNGFPVGFRANDS